MFTNSMHIPDSLISTRTETPISSIIWIFKEGTQVEVDETKTNANLI